MAKKALITGITGQDGSYLSELLLEKGYKVFGLLRPESFENESGRLGRVRHILDYIEIFTGSILDGASMLKVVQAVQPDECYHLAAQSFVSYELSDQSSTLLTNISGTLNVLSILNQVVPGCKFYFAGSSEMFGKVSQTPQTETTLFMPRSLYGVSKLSGYHMMRNYREKEGMFACAGILYNHESPRRSLNYVTRKITSTAVKIKLGLEKKLKLGNLEAKRDWGYAKDYVDAMWRMLQQENPGDYVVATGKLHTVKEFVEAVFKNLDLDWQEYVVMDQAFYRSGEDVPLCGQADKAKQVLGWQPTISFDELVAMMVKSDWELFSRTGKL